MEKPQKVRTTTGIELTFNSFFLLYSFKFHLNIEFTITTSFDGRNFWKHKLCEDPKMQA